MPDSSDTSKNSTSSSDNSDNNSDTTKTKNSYASTTPHYYFSTSCFHGEHEYCQASISPKYGTPKEPGRCKFCAAECICSCHYVAQIPSLKTTEDNYVQDQLPLTQPEPTKSTSISAQTLSNTSAQIPTSTKPTNLMAA